MTKPYQQFRNKAEAQQAIEDMGKRAQRAGMVGVLSALCGGAVNAVEERVSEYRAEAARIRALLPTLPD